MNEWPNSIQMQDWCTDRQNRYAYVVVAAWELFKNSDNEKEIKECVSLYMDEEMLTADWQLVYQCILRK